MKFKPTADEWNIIKEVAFRGHYTSTRPITSRVGVQLECRDNYNIDDARSNHAEPMPRSINMMITSRKPYEGCGDCDLWDRGTIYTDDFRKGAPLNERGDGLFDFYIYNRYDRGDGDLAGNILVEVRNGKMARIWIEGGNDWSWTPETGIAARMLRR